MNIGLDFDDVIAWTHKLKPFVAELLYDVKIPSNEFRRKSVVGKGILTAEQYQTVGREVYSGKYEVEEVPGAMRGIRFLLKAHHSIRIVTNRSDEWKSLEPAKRWLRRRSLNMPVTGIVFGSSKAPACEGIDVFVDDDPQKLVELAGVVPRRLLFRWPHTEHEPVPQGAVEVHSWKDICSYVQGESR